MTKLKEIWKPVINFESIYEVSSHGRVRSLDRQVNRRHDGSSKCSIKGKLLTPRITIWGYLRVTLTSAEHNFSKTIAVHRLVAMAFVLNSNNYPWINHIDNDKTNNRATNLEWCTPKQNTAHSTKQGRRATGAKHGMAKITDDEVKEIRFLRKNGYTLQSIANKFNFGKSNVHRIVTNKLWN